MHTSVQQGGGVTSRDPVEVQMLPQHAAFLASPQTFLHNVAAMCTVAISPAGRQLQPGVRRQKVKIQSEDEYVEKETEKKINPGYNLLLGNCNQISPAT